MPLGARDRVPKESTRTRRALGNLDILLDEPSGLQKSFAGLKVKHTANLGIAVDANGNYLDILNLVTDTLAAGDWIPFHDLTDAPNKITFANFEGTLNHDNLAGFVGNEHIDHTGVTLTAGTGISGGGTIAASRQFDLDILNLTTDTIAAGDWVPFHDLTDAPNKITFANFEGTLAHDSLSGYDANKHIDHTGVTLTAGTGISGGGDISAGRTFDLDILNLTTDTIAAGDWVPFHDLTDAPNKITFANFEGTLDHGSIAGLSDDDHTSYHTDARAVTWLAANHETTYTHTDIALNTTHRGSDGTDHGHIDQDVQTSASPTFNDLTISTPVNIYSLSHDSFADFVGNKHIDWTGATVNLVTTGSVSAGADTDTTSIFGRTRIGYGGSVSDYAWISHYDKTAIGDYALVQSSGGTTLINCSTGQSIELRINNVAKLVMDSNGHFNFQAGNLTTTGSLSVANDTDTMNYLGRVAIGGVSDVAWFSHVDCTGATEYAIWQSAIGDTAFNAKTGRGLYFRIGGATQLQISTTVLTATPKVRSNVGFNVNGTDGLSATYNFGGGGSGDIATMTFTGGILTAVTLVP